MSMLNDMAQYIEAQLRTTTLQGIDYSKKMNDALVQIKALEEDAVGLHAGPAPRSINPRTGKPFRERDYAPRDEVDWNDIPERAWLGGYEVPNKHHEVDLVLMDRHMNYPYYVVMVDGEPMAHISRSDQPKECRNGFSSESYAEAVIHAVRLHGFNKAMRLFYARNVGADPQLLNRQPWGRFTDRVWAVDKLHEGLSPEQQEKVKKEAF